MPPRVDEKVDGQEVFVYLPESHRISNLLNHDELYILFWSWTT